MSRFSKQRPKPLTLDAFDRALDVITVRMTELGLELQAAGVDRRIAERLENRLFHMATEQIRDEAR